MARYTVNKNHLIYRRLIKQGKKPKDLCRILEISENTLKKWIDDPGMIQLRDIISMAGFLKLDYDFLLYYLLRRKSIGLDKKGKRERAYIQEIKERNSKYKFID